MVQLVRYLSHPEVQVDPAIPVRRWGLSRKGRRRIEDFSRGNWLVGTTQIVSSDEHKAVEAAQVIADALKVDLEIRAQMYENDRSSTGFLPPDEFEKTADAFFAHPDESVRGWERAVDAQTRIVGEVEHVLTRPVAGDVLFVGHGAVGTLAYCHYSGNPISRDFDQPAGGGNFFSFVKEGRRVLHHWRRMEEAQIG